MSNWISSSFCSDGSCIRIDYVDGHVHVADEHGHTIRLDPETWATVVDGFHAGHTNPLPNSIRVGPNGVTWAGARPDNPNRLATLRYTRAEWDAFVAGVNAGDFDEVAV